MIGSGLKNIYLSFCHTDEKEGSDSSVSLYPAQSVSCNGFFFFFRAKGVLQPVLYSRDDVYDASSYLEKVSGIFSPTALSAKTLQFTVFILPCDAGLDCLPRPNTYSSRAENSPNLEMKLCIQMA